jgi:predicted amidohydrolase
VGATLIVGFLELHEGAVYDSVLTVGPTGTLGVYRKSHLYPPELTVFSAGETLGVVDTPAGVVGPLVCFEHAFPDVATTLALAGAQILVIPSAVPLGYEHVLHLRTRARAQDNQIFAVGCNMAGHGFAGRSLVTDPRGEVLAEAGERPAVLAVELDLAETRSERGREPSLRMRRPELYLRPGAER